MPHLPLSKGTSLAQDPSASNGNLWGNLGVDFTGLGFSSANVPRELKPVPFMEKKEYKIFFFNCEEKKFAKLPTIPLIGLAQ